ncbi:putative Fe-S cluster assembly protein SufT [Algiphilus sp.]|uniref:putative Fe-S cluster assembly protein SufT n=1 Tax=Algiphilus sp. TaxID=1872431 RepID=UPI0025B92F18|nr:putative Fe-S cluster assembly protein SufT [Algiphilus sp.]MCK5770000.1 putative Fe-S cluster assembly protein SufT [Algiphilus sp.]
MAAEDEVVTLQRDVIAALVPSGQRVELPEGTEARITQALGGSFTVVIQGHMFRIEGSDADCLGKEPPPLPEVSDDADEEEVKKAVYEQMGTVYDPEIPVDIVELGLIYRCELERADDGSYRIEVDMTLTAPGCGMGDFLVNDVRSKLLALPVVSEATVNLVFDPPWRQDMMSETAQLAVGFF